MSLAEEERRVDPYLGYPRSYAKLCRNGYAWMQLQGYALAYNAGPPKKFLPYTPQPDEIEKLEQLQDLFPIVTTSEFKDPKHLLKFKDVLWQQLDHLGNAGFDPTSFRVDAYGNVLYWHADPASPLAWEICHWFPYARGGRTVLSNLRIVQWQVKLRKKDKLEFLVPWWDLQLGVSVNQFLSAFESTNACFRQRYFSYFFLGGEDEMPEGKTCVSSHRWSRHFLEKQKLYGLAPAALLGVAKDSDDVFKHIGGSVNQSPDAKTAIRVAWTVDEEEALLRGSQKFGLGKWKEIKESEPKLSGRSLVQIRDKYRGLVGLDKENQSPLHEKPEGFVPEGAAPSSQALSSYKRECKIKMLREEERRMREEEFFKLRDSLSNIREENEREKAALDSLEAELRKHKKQVEKQRHWNETQAAYRLCLERMLQETMHQSVVYKEEARLNKVACSSLVAQLESQASACAVAESQLLQHSRERKSLVQAARAPLLLEAAPAKENVYDPPSAAQGKQIQVSAANSEREVLSSCTNTVGTKSSALQTSTAGEDGLSDSEELRSHKRLKKSSATPHKRCHSAPRQRMSKESTRPPPHSVRHRGVRGLDKLYYDGSRTVATTKKKAAPESETETPMADEAEDEKYVPGRTFKLMPVIKQDEQPDESGYASCGSQRFKGKGLILHAPRSRDSSERFEIDVAAVDSRTPEVSTPTAATMNPKPEAMQLMGDSQVEKGKATLERWLQMLLESEAEEKNDKEWPEGVAVPPPSVLLRGQSMRTMPGDERHMKKVRVPFSGLFRKLSLRHGANPPSRAAAAADCVVEEPRRKVTFEDWEGLSTKMATMNLEGRSNSLRASASAGTLPKSSSERRPPIHPAKMNKSVLYYSTHDFELGDEKQSLASIKAMSRRAAVNDCAEAWRKQVNVRSQQVATP